MHMKKFYLIVVAVFAFGLATSCGSKQTSEEKNADNDLEEQVDDEDEAQESDSEMTAPVEKWDEESVIMKLHLVYANVNTVFLLKEEGKEVTRDLCDEFCTKHWNEVLTQVRALNSSLNDPSEMRFANERFFWNYWGEGQVQPKDIKVELLTDNMAEATFNLTHGDEWMHTKLSLVYENHQWRIDDWLEVGDNGQSLLEDMKEYVE